MNNPRRRYLYILKGDVPAVTGGRILGHEGVGTIIEVGQAVSKLAVGDRVIITGMTCEHCVHAVSEELKNLEGSPA
jgi:alcohol dehydrogenase